MIYYLSITFNILKKKQIYEILQVSGTIQDQCVRLCFRPQLDDNCFCGIAAEAILSVLWKGAMVKVTLRHR